MMASLLDNDAGLDNDTGLDNEPSSNPEGLKGGALASSRDADDDDSDDDRA